MPDVFRTIDWLDENRTGATVVDVRDRREYDAGHVPGAVNLPFDDFRDPTDETPGKLPTADDFGRLLGRKGVGPSDRLVAYDGEFGVYASRFLVTAAVFGHDADRLHLLDGDYGAWERAYPTATRSPDVPVREYACERSPDAPLIDAADLEAALESDAVIVDTRDSIEYDTVHVPGAINLQWRALVDETERRLRSPSDCRRILDDHGIALDRPIRLYCNTARRLSFVYAVLRHLGHDDVAIYEGGIAAWANYGGPVETTS